MKTVIKKERMKEMQERELPMNFLKVTYLRADLKL